MAVHTAEKKAPRTAWKRIADDLAAEIASGDHEPGKGLPTALDLAARYGVHRHTARQALRHLQDQGLVSVEQGRGSFVTGRRFPYRIGRSVSFRQNFNAAGIEATGRILSVHCITIPISISQSLELPTSDSVWRVEALNSAGGKPISVSIHYLSTTRFADFPSVLRNHNTSISEAFRSYGIESYERLSTSLSARLATQEEVARLDLSYGDPVLTSEGIDSLPDGTPLQVVESAFSPARVQFIVEHD
jgi:GntR family transcriptional regulator, phosphonate transport system regulatory protein